MWQWCVELSTWWFMTLGEPHTSFWLDQSLTILTCTKEPWIWRSLLGTIWLDHFWRLGAIWKVFQIKPCMEMMKEIGALCSRWEMVAISFPSHFNFSFRLWAKALLKISLPHLLLLEVTYPLWKILEVMWVLCLSHTHTHTKIKIKHSMKSQRALFSSLFPLQIIIS